MLLPPLLLAVQLPTLQSNDPPPSTVHEPLAARETLERCAAKLEDPSFEHTTLLVAEQFDAAILSDSGINSPMSPHLDRQTSLPLVAAPKSSCAPLPEDARG